jgi:hypothetical protein
MKDPIVDEIHERRVRRAEAFHHDIDAMIADIRRREAVSRSQGVKFVTPRKRKKTPIK